MKLITIASLALFATPALAAEPAPMTVSECLNVLAGLRALDGRPVIIAAGKANETVTNLPYEFGNAKLRVTIASNIAALTAVETSNQKVQQDTFKEIAKEAMEIKPGTPDYVRYNKLVSDAQQLPCGVTLARIKIEDLKLDKTEIAGSVLGALDKILDR